MPRVLIDTIPQAGRLLLSRRSVISLSAHNGAPADTGFGRRMSPQPRFAAAFSDVSRTDKPSTTASVSVETTSGRLNSVPDENSELKCTWFVFIVSAVNQILSVSVIVRPR